MRLTQAVCAFVLLAAIPIAGLAQTVTWDVIAAGGEVSVASGGMRLAATVGQAAVGIQTGPSYAIWAGFWNPGLWGPVGSWELGPEVPTVFSLSRSYPNPCRERSTLVCGLPRQCQVSVGVYDLTGRLIHVLSEGIAEAGYHTVQWDGNDMNNRASGSGVYICRMTALASPDARCELQRLILLIR